MAKPSRTFTGSVGEHTTGTAGPEALKTDIGNAMAMFDPAKTLSDGSAGGISAENINDDAIETDAILDGAVTAAKCAADVATQAELDTHAALTTGVHGATGAIVGTTGTQSLSAKTIVLANNTNYTTFQARNIVLSTGDPSGGGNGDIWLKYTA